MVQKLATIDNTPSLLAAPSPSATGDEANLKVDAYGALLTAPVQVAAEYTLFESAARTTTVNTEVTNTKYKGVIVVFDWTVEAATSTLTLHIEGYSTLGDDWYTILSSAALTSIGTTVYRVYPGAVASANLIADDWLPPKWRFRVAVGDSDSSTYSANAILLP